MGVNTALVGSSHPYSRVIGDKIDYCQWYDEEMIPSPTASLWYNIYNQLSFLVPFDETKRSQRIHSDIFREARNLAVDPVYGLVFIHFPIPHAPFRNAKWGFWNITPKGYLGNLELADQAFGQLRKGMEEQGLWENTTILITSDHQWRKANRFDGKKLDPRVPFIMKLAGEKTGTVFQPSFSTVLTKDLLLAIFQRQIQTNDDLINWLNEHHNDVALK